MKSLLFTISFLIPFFAFAQSPRTSAPLGNRVISLEEAITLGQNNSLTSKTKVLQMQMAQGERNKVDARRSPIVSANGELRSNLVLPTTIIPAGAFGGGVVRARIKNCASVLPSTSLAALNVSYSLIDPTLRTDQLRADGQECCRKLLWKNKRPIFASPLPRPGTMCF